jgi:hypothetical protein
LARDSCTRYLCNSLKVTNKIPNVRAECLALLRRIRGGPGFKSLPEDRLSWLKFFVVLLSPYKQMTGQYFKLIHDRFLPYPFQFIISSWRCIMWAADGVVKQAALD